MLCTFESKRTIFKHNLNSKLLLGVAISSRRALLFYSNSHYYNYDTHSRQVKHNGDSKNIVYKAVLLNDSQVLCMIPQGLKLVRLEFEKDLLSDICQLPPTPTQDPILDKALFFASEVGVFKQTGIFYVDTLYKHQNKRKILAFPDSKSNNHFAREFYGSQTVCQKIDQRSRVIIYHQHVQEDVDWEIKIVDLAQGTDQRYVVHNQYMKPGLLISRVLLRSEKELYLFIGGEQPRILILSLGDSYIVTLKYHLSPNLLDILFYDQSKQLLCFSFLQHNSLSGEVTQNTVQIINLQRQQLLAKTNISLKSTSLPLDNDYILDVAAESKPGNVTIFHTRHIIRKKAMVFHTLVNSGVFTSYGPGIGRMVISMFQF